MLRTYNCLRKNKDRRTEMKNYKIEGLNGRVTMKARDLMKAMDLKQSLPFFVSGKNCHRCVLVEKEIQARNILVFEIPHEEYFKIKDKGLPFVFSFPTGILLEKGKVKETFVVGEDPIETFVDRLCQSMDQKETVLENPFLPVYDKKGNLRHYKVGEGSLEKLI